MQAHDAASRREVFAARDHHAAFPRGDCLGGIEREHGGITAQRTDQTTAVRRRQRMRSVLHHRNAVSCRQGEEWIHVARQSGEMHRHDHLRSRGDPGLDLRHVEVEGDRVDVHEDRMGTEIPHHLRRGRECVRGGDDLVTRADPERLQGDVQSSGG